MLPSPLNLSIMSSESLCENGLGSDTAPLEHVELHKDWEDVICPICLDIPHNGVLLQCSAYDQGCRPFMCDTDHTHSNCLDRYMVANGMPVAVDDPTAVSLSEASVHSMETNTGIHPACPLCRGEVTGWIVIDEARAHLNQKTRCCEEEHCGFIGNYLELQNHGKLLHPYARPSEIDSARQLDWDNFQQSSEIIDVLSSIQTEIPHGVVLGDYVIEFGQADSVDEYEDFFGDEGNWWASCLINQAFDSFREARNRRTRVGQSRSGSLHSVLDVSDFDDISYADYGDHGVDDTGEEFADRGVSARRSSTRRSSRRRRARFNDH